MGAWDTGSFDNDDAADWLAELEEDGDFSLVGEALDPVLDAGAGGYVDSPECSVAIAACEVLAALGGYPMRKLPSEVADFVEANEGIEFVDLIGPALKAVKRIRSDSELKELWDESENSAQWAATLDDLAVRLEKARSGA